MIILDLNQVMISNLMAQIGNHTNIDIDENLLRHMILNTIRALNMKFKSEYGELIIACDDKNYWRKDIFPFYKASRSEDRDKSEINWTVVFNSLNKIRQELKDFFPYKVIQIDRAEADDIIGTLVHERFGKTFGGEKVLILSGDKDFKQLQIYPNVFQYDPVKKKFLRETDPERYLKEHIIRGDKGDGVPNILSDANSYVIKKRCKSIFETKLDLWLKCETPEQFCDSKQIIRWYQNRDLVDLKRIPDSVKSEILNTFDSMKSKGRGMLFDYFINHNIKNLMDSIGDF